MVDDLRPVPGGPSDDDYELLERELGLLARDLTSADTELQAPPPDLWSAIEAEADVASDVGVDVDVDVDVDPRPVPPVRDASAAESPRRDSDGIRTSRVGAERGRGGEPRRMASPASPRTRGRSGLYGIPAALAAAAVLALILATGAALFVRIISADELVAQADITNEGLPVPVDGSGTATLRQRGDDLYLELDLPELAAADADSFYEVWMIDGDIDGMISLGGFAAAAAGTTRIDLPDNIDPDGFPVVDISVEPLDGDPTHSGQSVLRGELTEATGA